MLWIASRTSQPSLEATVIIRRKQAESCCMHGRLHEILESTDLVNNDIVQMRTVLMYELGERSSLWGESFHWTTYSARTTRLSACGLRIIRYSHWLHNFLVSLGFGRITNEKNLSVQLASSTGNSMSQPNGTSKPSRHIFYMQFHIHRERLRNHQNLCRLQLEGRSHDLRSNTSIRCFSFLCTMSKESSDATWCVQFDNEKEYLLLLSSVYVQQTEFWMRAFRCN